jgi:RNA-directed DNA polymerase
VPETVNGPEGVSEWDVINWAVHEQNVARLRQRIFTAARDGDWPKVRNLQKMMLWTAPGILEAVKPGRMQGHGGTAEVSGGAA